MHPLSDSEIKQMTDAFNLDAAYQDHEAVKNNENLKLALQLNVELKTILNDLRWQQQLLNQVRSTGKGTIFLKISNVVGIGYARNEVDEVKSQFVNALKERLSQDIQVDFEGPESFLDRWYNRGNIIVSYRGPRVYGGSGGMSGTTTISSVTQGMPVPPLPLSAPGNPGDFFGLTAN